jgi:hypothetical protein
MCREDCFRSPPPRFHPSASPRDSSEVLPLPGAPCLGPPALPVLRCARGFPGVLNCNRPTVYLSRPPPASPCPARVAPRAVCYLAGFPRVLNFSCLNGSSDQGVLTARSLVSSLSALRGVLVFSAPPRAPPPRARFARVSPHASLGQGSRREFRWRDLALGPLTSGARRALTTSHPPACCPGSCPWPSHLGRPACPHHLSSSCLLSTPSSSQHSFASLFEIKCPGVFSAPSLPPDCVGRCAQVDRNRIDKCSSSPPSFEKSAIVPDLQAFWYPPNL